MAVLWKHLELGSLDCWHRPTAVLRCLEPGDNMTSLWLRAGRDSVLESTAHMKGSVQVDLEVIMSLPAHPVSPGSVTAL